MANAVYCKDCGTVGPRKRSYRGSDIVSFLLWVPPAWQFVSMIWSEMYFSMFRSGTYTPNKNTVAGAQEFARLQFQASHIDAHNTALGITMFAILVLAIPGFCYSIWRHMTAHNGCANCRSAAVIPTDSPVAQAALAGR